MSLDRRKDLRPHRDRQRVAHALYHHQLRAGYRPRGRLPAVEPHQWVGIAVNNERRHRDGGERLLAAAGCDDRGELARDTRWIEAALEDARTARGIARLIERKAPPAQDLPGLQIAFEVCVAIR